MRGSPLARCSRAVVFALMVGTQAACTRPSPVGEPVGTGRGDASPAAPLAASPHPRLIAIPPRQGPGSALVILLHGVGADAESFQDVGRVLGERLVHAELLVPDGFHPWDGGGTGRQWFSLGQGDAERAARVRQAGQEVSRWIDGELAERHLGADRLGLVGFSQRAMVAAWLAVHRSPRPAAVALLSGLVAEDQAPPSGAAPVPVLLAHGDRDVRISVSTVEPSARVLTAWGARVTTRIDPGLGHEVGGLELRAAGDFLAAARCGD